MLLLQSNVSISGSDASRGASHKMKWIATGPIVSLRDFSAQELPAKATRLAERHEILKGCTIPMFAKIHNIKPFDKVFMMHMIILRQLQNGQHYP